LTTFTFDKKLFLEQMGIFVKDDEAVILTSSPCGIISTSKKHKGKIVTMLFAEEVFAKPDTISDIINSKIVSIIVCKKDILSDKAKEILGEKK
jgi:hypothetical protein